MKIYLIRLRQINFVLMLVKLKFHNLNLKKQNKLFITWNWNLIGKDYSQQTQWSTSTFGKVRIFTPARFFCPKGNLYIFGNFMAFGFFWDMCPIFDRSCAIYRLEQNDVMKQFSFNCCRYWLCAASMVHSLISAHKSYRLTKFCHDDTIFVCFTDQNQFPGYSL